MSDFRSTQKIINKFTGFSELLGYAFMVNNQVVMLKDASLQALFTYYGDDVQAITDDMRFSLANRWSGALTRFFGENVIVEMDLCRKQVSKYSDAIAFPDRVSALIDQERAWQFRDSGDLFETHLVLSITWREGKQLSTASKKFMYDSDDAIEDRSIEDLLRDFESRLGSFISFVGSNKFERLTGDGITSFLDHCIAGQNRRIACPTPRTELDAYLSKADWIAGQEPRLGDKHIMVLTVEDFPGYMESMILDGLNSLPIAFRYHLRFVRLSKRQAEGELKRAKRSWSSKAIGLKGVVVQAFGGQAKLNDVFEQRRIESEQAIAENEDAQVSYGLITGSFVLMDQNRKRLLEHAMDIKAHVENLGFTLRIERVNAADAYLGSFPGHGESNLRMLTMDSLTAAMCMPLASIYAGEPHCPCPYYPKGAPPLFYARTSGSNIYRFNNFNEDVGHTMVIGPTGSGKTTFIEHMLVSHRKYENAQQIFIGKDQCGRIPVLSLGGKFFDLADEGTLALAPLANLDNDMEVELAKTWLKETFVLNGLSLNADMKIEIDQAISRLKSQPVSRRTISNLTFQHDLLRATFNELNTGMFKRLLGGHSTKALENSAIGFDLTNVFELEQGVSMPIVLAILASLTAKFQSGRPTLLLLDEAWLLLDHEIFLARLKDWLKTLRKFNVSVVFSSQSLSDVFDSTIAPVLIESCPTQVFLPNGRATSESIKEKYQGIGLNTAEINLVANATPKREYFIVQPKGRRVIDLTLGESALAFVGVPPKEKTFNNSFCKDDDHWLLDYLNAKGLHEMSDFASEVYFQEERVSA